jgi:phenylacetate-CoA ligase
MKDTCGNPMDSWETLSESERTQEIRSRLTDYIEFAQNTSPFYSQRLKHFAPASHQPLREIPILQSTDLRENLPPFGKNLISSQAQGYTVFQSGGTTGIPKSSLFSNEELELLTPANTRGFRATGLQTADRVANFWAVGGLYMTFIHMNRMLQQYGCTNFPFANNTPADFVHTVTKLFNINVFTGISSLALGMLRNLKSLGLEGIQVRKIYFGGEHLYEADLRELREDFGIELVKAPGYGTVDSWYIGYQCLATPLGYFHAHDDQAYIEIIDEETREICGPDRIGMMHVTAFPRRATPIVRYRVGDRARWTGEACSCGRTTPVFQLLGRGDDVLRIGYDSVEYEGIQTMILTIPELSGSVQMEKVRLDGRDQLVVRVESRLALPLQELNSIGRRLEEQILADRPTLRMLVEKKVIWPSKVEIVPEGSLKRNPRTGKLIRVIDAIKE